jgi:flagellar basal body-associated protein FliL
MADQEDTRNEQDTEPEAQKAQAPRRKALPWLITVGAVLVCAGAGFVIGRVFGTRGGAQTAAAAQPANPAESATVPPLQAGTDGAKSWYYDLEPVVANLNEPGVSRYVRVGLTLEIDGRMDQKEGTRFFDDKGPLLKHWLTLYLSNLTVEDVRGEENLQHLPTQVADEFNRKLFPNAEPRIKHVLFKEFSVQ